MSDQQEYMKEMLDRRIQTVKDRAALVYDTYVTRLEPENPAYKINREFLEKHAVGVGVDICCGDFVTADAIGVDPAIEVLGADYRLSDGELSFSKARELDYVVTNYL